VIKVVHDCRRSWWQAALDVLISTRTIPAITEKQNKRMLEEPESNFIGGYFSGYSRTGR
jgi:hypothetical protein